MENWMHPHMHKLHALLSDKCGDVHAVVFRLILAWRHEKCEERK